MWNKETEMTIIDNEVKINIDELVKMIAHKCQCCKYKDSQCSEVNGCETGILNWLKDEAGVR